MSYDLFFRPRNGRFDKADFHRYFQQRAHYNADVFYANEDTGVYFGFELRAPNEEPSSQEFPVAFNINFFRPSFFIREAEPEISRAVREFDWTVFDPQTDGMGEGEYQSDLLISGWDFGNRFAYSAVLRDPASRADIFSLPTPTLMRIWQWNYGRSTLQQEMGDGTFVPRISFTRLDNQLITIAVWPDAIPIVVPVVDYLLVPRKELSPRRLFKRVEDRALLAWGDALPILERHGSPLADAISLDYLRPPKDVTDFVRSLPATGREIVGVAIDKILDRELVDQVTA